MMTKRAQFHLVILRSNLLSYIESAKTGASKQSLRSKVMESIKEEGGNKEEWDQSVKSMNK